MIIPIIFLSIFCTVIPAMLHAGEVMYPSMYFIILAGVILLISAILIISAFCAPVSAGTVAGLLLIIGMVGIAVSTVMGGVSFSCYKLLPAKTVTQTEQIKVPVKTKPISEKNLNLSAIAKSNE